jgi:AcrR family transcriptional regulator
MPKRRPPRPASPSPPDPGTKARIQVAARAEFAQYGRAGARVDRIAQRADVNKAMIYYHFHSKDNLYAEVIRDHFAEITRQVQARIIHVESIEQRLKIVAEAHGNMALGGGDFRSLILRELADPRDEVLAQIADVFNASGLSDTMRGELESAMDRGEIRRMDVCQVVVAFVTMSLGYFILAPIIDRVWGIDDRAAFIEERKHVMIDLFMNGLKARKP